MFERFIKCLLIILYIPIWFIVQVTMLVSIPFVYIITGKGIDDFIDLIPFPNEIFEK